MTKWFGAIALAGAMMIGGAVTPSASAAPAEVTKEQAARPADLSARRQHHSRHYFVYGGHYAYRPYYPYYYGRPSYYSPGPFMPFPPIIGWEDPWLW